MCPVQLVRVDNLGGVINARQRYLVSTKSPVKVVHLIIMGAIQIHDNTYFVVISCTIGLFVCLFRPGVPGMSLVVVGLRWLVWSGC